MIQDIWDREAWKSLAMRGRAMLTMLLSKVAMKAPRQAVNSTLF